MNQVLQEISPKTQNQTGYADLAVTNDATKEVYYPESDGKPMTETDKHRKLINQLIDVLDIHFADDKNIYVTGNIMFYYEEGNPYRSVAPDVMFVRGVTDKDRRVYKLWEENTMPQVVFEITSRSTRSEDLHRKWNLYEKLGVLEYYIFDPEHEYFEPFIACKRQEGELMQVEITEGRIFSEELGLEIVDTGETLRLFDPKTNVFLRTSQESENALREAETEITRLRALLENKA
ncbi:MAG: Uma2 family endonuclease [Pyrinomonadaceae bacterium]|nr:Uma2 family endonuclease [Pyrinomonadaceae bacterium]